MRIRDIAITNIRCFAQEKIELDSPLVHITGFNGAGKSSVLEALSLLTTGKSFRTVTITDILRDTTTAGAIRGNIYDDNNNLTQQITVGLTPRARTIKVDALSIRTNKELFKHVRSLSITEEDLQLITGSPEERRIFLDSILANTDPEYALCLRKYRAILEQRNALLKTHNPAFNAYIAWTEQLDIITHIIRQRRSELIQELTTQVNQLLTHIRTPPANLTLSAHSIPLVSTTERWEREQRAQRTLWGPHLDDCIIEWEEHHARSYASRGQQKLLLILLKCAAANIIQKNYGPVIFLLDDIATDFDSNKLQDIINLIVTCSAQTIITSPTGSTSLEKILTDLKTCTIQL